MLAARLRHVLPLVAAVLAGNAALYACLCVERAWPLAAVALVPWITLACRRGPIAPWIAFAAVMPAYALMHRAIGRHAPISHALIAVAYACALVPSAWMVRAAARRSWPSFAVGVGAVWAASEIVRTLAVVPPWHRLAVALYAQPRLVQIADLAGMAGVTFALAVCNAALAAALLRRTEPEITRSLSPRRELTVALTLSLAVVVYGHARMVEARRTVHDGPRVLVVETDVLPDTLGGTVPEHALVTQATALTVEALAAHPRVDWIQWPEATSPRALDDDFHRARPDDPALLAALTRDPSEPVTAARAAVLQADARGALTTLTRRVDTFGVPLLVGADALVPARPRWEHRNAMYLLAPGAAQPLARHDKVLTFPVYESVPWRTSAPAIASLFARIRPPHSPPEITPAAHPVAFRVGPWTVHSPICFETETPEYTRDWLPESHRGRLVWSHGANDWWGERSDDVLHAFRFEVFRAIEGRVGIARSANAGFAGFVSPTGELHDVVGGDRAARMPAPGRPERDALRRARALLAERESVEDALSRAENEGERLALEARDERLRGAILAAQREATALARGVAVKGARVAAVRIDTRRPWYPRVGRWIEHALVLLWVLGAAGAVRAKAWR